MYEDFITLYRLFRSKYPKNILFNFENRSIDMHDANILSSLCVSPVRRMCVCDLNILSALYGCGECDEGLAALNTMIGIKVSKKHFM